MKTRINAMLAVTATAMLGACASGPPPATEFPAGARTPAAAEIGPLVKGRSFNLGNGGIRVDYAADSDGITAYFSGNVDRGTWRAEMGVCALNSRTSRRPATTCGWWTTTFT